MLAVVGPAEPESDAIAAANAIGPAVQIRWGAVLSHSLIRWHFGSPAFSHLCVDDRA